MGVGRLVVLHFTLLVALQGTTTAKAQGNEWAWMGGTNTGVASSAIYGTMGTPAASNIPPARYQAATWTDSHGNFWIFGGGNGYLFGGGIQGVFDSFNNDVWKFNPSTKQWTWMGGSTASAYGTLAVAAAGNLRTGRLGAASWVDANGNFWMFGGDGLDANGALGMLNDLWEYDPSSGQWTWMGGSSTFGSNCFLYDIGGPNERNCAQPGVYGTMGTPSSTNIPRGRTGATTWTDQNGNLWLFGGWGYDISNQVEYYFNDLWRFNPTTKQWTWMGGSNTGSGSACFFSTMLYYLSCGEPGSYGALLTPSSATMPGGREGAMGWTDNNASYGSSADRALM
jgi:Kelch motif/Galactose oxidase, central domain